MELLEGDLLLHVHCTACDGRNIITSFSDPSNTYTLQQRSHEVLFQIVFSSVLKNMPGGVTTSLFLLIISGRRLDFRSLFSVENLIIIN